MSDEKIDWAKIATYERGIIRQIDELAQLGQMSPMKLEMRRDAQARLALVALARAAVKFSNSGHVADRMALDAALAPFTDSAEVRSDGT